MANKSDDWTKELEADLATPVTARFAINIADNLKGQKLALRQDCAVLRTAANADMVG